MDGVSGLRQCWGMMHGWVRRGLRAVMEAVLPGRCLACGAAVRDFGADRAGTVCPECFAALRFALPPVCGQCGWPLLPESGTCLRCEAERSGAVRRRRFALIYGETAARLIVRCKHADRPEIASRLAVWMVRAADGLIADADVLVPVPVHWTRLASRQYNQAAEIARRIARDTGAAWDPMLLRRVRPTPIQGHRNPAARRANVAGAFALRRGGDVEGKTVLLIDDVYTTGATAEECAKILRRAGAAAVDVLVAAAVEGGRSA